MSGKAAMLFGAVTLAAIGAAAPANHGDGAALVREAAIVCGTGGCNIVHTKAIKRRAFKPLEYTKPLPKSS